MYGGQLASWTIYRVSLPGAWCKMSIFSLVVIFKKIVHVLKRAALHTVLTDCFHRTFIVLGAHQMSPSISNFDSIYKKNIWGPLQNVMILKLEIWGRRGNCNWSEGGGAANLFFFFFFFRHSGSVPGVCHTWTLKTVLLLGSEHFRPFLQFSDNLWCLIYDFPIQVNVKLGDWTLFFFRPFWKNVSQCLMA